MIRLREMETQPPDSPSGWFDVRVFYVKISCCLADEAPDSVLVRLPPRSIEMALEVNGGRIPPSEEANLLLRRDRTDADCEEVTYVSTDNLRASESVLFQIRDRQDLLISGVLEKEFDVNAIQGVGSRWKIACSCEVGSSGCAFFRTRTNRPNLSAGPPSMEVYVVGHCIGSPVILTQTIQLTCRRKNERRSSLDTIPEDAQPSRMQISTLSEDPHLYTEEGEEEFHSLKKKASAVKVLYSLDEGFWDSEEVEASWFNAGVRVGVGIGLGICLGVGVGVGLFVQAYRTTSRSLRRRPF